jgi:hypothetical protein
MMQRLSFLTEAPAKRQVTALIRRGREDQIAAFRSSLSGEVIGLTIPSTIRHFVSIALSSSGVVSGDRLRTPMSMHMFGAFMKSAAGVGGGLRDFRHAFRVRVYGDHLDYLHTPNRHRARVAAEFRSRAC